MYSSYGSVASLINIVPLISSRSYQALTFLSPSLPPHPPPLPQKPPHIFKSQPLRLRIYPPRTDPAYSTHYRIRDERPRRAQVAHHRQERQTDYEVAAPVGSCREAGSERADGKGEEFALVPCDVAEAGGVGADVDYEGEEDEDGRRGGGGGGGSSGSGNCSVSGIRGFFGYGVEVEELVGD